MPRLRFILLAGLAGLVLPAFSKEEDKGAKLTLISEASTISGGKPFRVGLKIHHQADYHTYWKSPGVVGFPTTIDWQLPEGFTAGPIEWPVPEIVDMSGHAAHGYTRDVLLTTEITPPEKITDPQVTLRARIAWMACADACNPGNRRFTMTLPSGTEMVPDPEHATLFEAADKAQPKALEGWTAKVQTPVDSEVIRLVLSRSSETAPQLDDPYFFSEDGQISSVPPVVTRDEAGSLILQFPRSEYSPKHATRLSGVLVFGPKDHRHHATIAPEVIEK